MSAIQLELNIHAESQEDFKLSCMQKQIDEICVSMGKVRRKLFAEMGEVKKLCHSLERENKELKSLLEDLKNEKVKWVYAQEGYLFNVSEHKEAVG